MTMEAMETPEQRIRTLAVELLREGKIDMFVGLRRGVLPLTGTPCFIPASRGGAQEDLEQAVGQLVWGGYSAPNLAAYLVSFYEPDLRLKQQPEKPVLGLQVRSCELRSVYTLVREKQVPRDKLVLVGVPCRGMVDLRRLREKLDLERVTDAVEEPGALKLKLPGGEVVRLDREEFIEDACRECRRPSVPEESVDFLVDGPSRKEAAGVYDAVRAFEDRPVEERWRIFLEETSKCIRCYACRQACPTCYCRDCFAEQTDLHWIGASAELSDIQLFHLVRIFHQAGRCSSCGACARACPVGVDLRTFTQKIVKDVDEFFGSLPGFSLEEVSPLNVFREDDGEEFMSEP